MSFRRRRGIPEKPTKCARSAHMRSCNRHHAHKVHAMPRFPFRRSRRGVLLVRADDPRPQASYENVVRGEGGGPYACPCCGYITLPERGSYELCPICFWEDDGQDDHDAEQVRRGPNGNLSLAEARRNFALIGACD